MQVPSKPTVSTSQRSFSGQVTFRNELMWSRGRTRRYAHLRENGDLANLARSDGARDSIPQWAGTGHIGHYVSRSKGHFSSAEVPASSQRGEVEDFKSEVSSDFVQLSTIERSFAAAHPRLTQPNAV